MGLSTLVITKSEGYLLLTQKVRKLLEDVLGSTAPPRVCCTRELEDVPPDFWGAKGKFYVSATWLRMKLGPLEELPTPLRILRFVADSNCVAVRQTTKNSYTNFSKTALKELTRLY